MPIDLLSMREALIGDAVQAKTPHPGTLPGVDPELAGIYKQAILPKLSQLGATPAKEPMGVLEGAWEGAKATPEFLAELGIGLAGMVPSGFAGIAGEILEPGKGAEWMDKFQQGFRQAMYLGNAPEEISPTAEYMLDVVNWPFEKLRQGADVIGHKVADISGSPMLGASTAALIEAGVILLGPKAVKGVRRADYMKLRRDLKKSLQTGDISEGTVDNLAKFLDDMRNSPHGPDMELYDKIIKQAQATVRDYPYNPGKQPVITPETGERVVSDYLGKTKIKGEEPLGVKTVREWDWNPETGYTPPSGPPTEPTVAPTARTAVVTGTDLLTEFGPKGMTPKVAEQAATQLNAGIFTIDQLRAKYAQKATKATADKEFKVVDLRTEAPKLGLHVDKETGMWMDDVGNTYTTEKVRDMVSTGEKPSFLKGLDELDNINVMAKAFDAEKKTTMKVETNAKEALLETDSKLNIYRAILDCLGLV